MERRRGPAGGPRTRIGLGLVLVAWTLNWALPGLRTHVLFFPLWLGYVLALDGLALVRTGTSLGTRDPRGFAALFALSMPMWWLFELANRRLGNWEYLGREHFTAFEYAVLCSISFSTVVPAVLVTAELVRGTRWIERFAHGPRLRSSTRLTVGLALSGTAMLAAMIAWPRAAYPFVWVGGVLVLEALCQVLGRRSLVTPLRDGDWRPWIALWSGGLVCGFFWELWNVWSYPKWIYHIPGVGFAKVFEMPLLGYLGYLPFAHEVFLVKQLVLPGRAEPRL